MTDENLSEEAKRKGLSGKLGSARDVVRGSLDKLSGAEYRRQLEQFTNVVETTVVGIHRDQQELNARLEKLEKSKVSTPTRRLIVTALIFSVTAIILAIVAVVASL